MPVLHGYASKVDTLAEMSKLALTRSVISYVFQQQKASCMEPVWYWKYRLCAHDWAGCFTYTLKSCRRSAFPIPCYTVLNSRRNKWTRPDISPAPMTKSCGCQAHCRTVPSSVACTSSVRFSTSHTRTVEALPALARKRPSWLKAHE